ncbi:MAG: ABC transporter permease [Chloroflexi bacterium]|nr:ABC transporter permease [Chloroflexota bacterium]
MTFLRQAWAIAAKDLAAEVHTKEMLSAMAVYSVLGLLTFSLALDLRGAAARAVAPGVWWVLVTFAGMLGLSRSLGHEREEGAMDGLLLAPVDRGAILAGKALANLLVILAVEAFLLPLCAALLGVSLLQGGILVVILVASVGYAVAGTLLAAMAVNTRAQAVALPVLLLPMVAPVVVAAVQATAALLDGGTLGQVGGWLRLLVVYDLVVAAIALLAFPYVVEE